MAAIPDLFTADEAGGLVRDGALRLDWASHSADDARVILTAVGAYQLGEILKASERLTARGLPHTVVYMLEPGRFRMPRSDGEQRHLVPRDVLARLYPDSVTARVFVTHTRTEPLLGTVGPLNTARGTMALGFSNQGGTLSVEGLLFVNGSTWAHCLDAVARLVGLDRGDLLAAAEIAALDRRRSPHGVVIREDSSDPAA